MREAWKNRIVSVGVMPASDFLGNEDNWRIHPKPQQDAMGGVLDSVGWVQSVMVNLRTSPQWGGDRGVQTLIDGHMRVMLALRQGEDTPVPVVFVDLDPEEEDLILQTLDPIGAMAVSDRPKLAALMQKIETDQPALQEMISKLAEREGLFFEGAELPADFPEFDEAVEVEVQFHTCPNCGHQWPK